MILGAALRGITAHVVRVTAHREPGLPTFMIKGLATAAERESRVRVQASLATTAHTIDGRLTVALDAAGHNIDGTALDLAIALAAATAGEDSLGIGALGELSLSGEIRPVRGALASVEELKKHVEIVLVAPENAAEAMLVDGVRVVVVRRLTEALEVLAGRRGDVETRALHPPPSAPTYADMRDIRGQQAARRALEVAAAGRHNLLIVGGPGAGKTMLSRRLTGILPSLTESEALEVTRVHSAAGLNIGGGLITTRPFRAPHHSTTPPGLVGGGASHPRPGEVTLAHHGVLFLDELAEFSRPALEVLREPIETGEVMLARSSGRACARARDQRSAHPGSPPRPCTSAVEAAERREVRTQEIVPHGFGRLRVSVDACTPCAESTTRRRVLARLQSDAQGVNQRSRARAA